MKVYLSMMSFLAHFKAQISSSNKSLDFFLKQYIEKNGNAKKEKKIAGHFLIYSERNEIFLK
jgi:hypothetical protein